MKPTAGVGFKAEHFVDAMRCAGMNRAACGLWFEVHAENYMVDGGPRLAMLEALRRAFPLSLHGVGLSLAADAEPDRAHIARLKRLVARFEPFAVSEHLAWSSWRGVYHPGLLPFPRSRAALARVVANVDRVQAALGRQILIENPALYMPLDGDDLSETEFLRELVRRSGCGLLVDVNNVFVSAHNLGFCARDYLDAIPGEAVGEIHLAGHSVDTAHDDLLIDSHDAPVSEEVWRLYRRFVQRIGPRPTLIERDADLPPFDALLAERDLAHAVLSATAEAAHV